MRGEGGERCPEIEHAPRTAEGRAVMATLGRPGIWQRAGMDGTIAGLNLAEAMASLCDTVIDREFARALFMRAEQHFLPAYWQAKEANSKTEDEKS